jgi:hypothetical protein
VWETVALRSIGQIVGEIDGTVFGEVMRRREMEAVELPKVDEVNTHKSCPLMEVIVLRLS